MPQARRLGSYELNEVIGSGATGQVWRAVNSAGEPVAIKLLRSDLLDDPRIVQQFIAERSTLQQVQGNYVTRVRDLVAEGGQLGIVMDLIPGGSVRDLLRREGTLAPADLCDLGAKCAQGVTLLHAADLVHGDLKPENVLLVSDRAPWEPRLTDFGISQAIEQGTDGAEPATSVVGTPAYIAPELLAGQPVSRASDVYAVGIMVYEFVCGITPFAHPSTLTVLRRQGDQAPGRPDGIDPRLWALLVRMLAKDPADRPTAIQVSTELNRLAPSVVSLPALAALSKPPAGVPIGVANSDTVRVATNPTPTAHVQDTVITGSRVRPTDSSAPVLAPVVAASAGSTRRRGALAAGVAAVLTLGGIGAYTLTRGTPGTAASPATVVTVTRTGAPGSGAATPMSSSTARPPVSTITVTASGQPEKIAALAAQGVRYGRNSVDQGVDLGEVRCPGGYSDLTGVLYQLPHRGSTSCTFLRSVASAARANAGADEPFEAVATSDTQGSRSIRCDAQQIVGYVHCQSTATGGGTQVWVPK